jgi:integrase
MARGLLSETRIRTLTKPGIYADGDGLYLRVQKAGSRNWLFIFRRGAKRTEIGLGGYGRGTAPVSLALAREKAEDIRQRLARGEDARGAKPARVVTFRHVMDLLLESKADGWRNDKHHAQWVMTLTEYAAPLHGLPVADLVVGDVVETLRPHWSARPETADRLRSRIQAVIDYAIAHGWRISSNPARWKGLLDKLLPAPPKLSRGHHKAAAYKDMPAIMAGLRGSSSVAARAVEFIALTAARSGEARGATWAEFDLDAALWAIPAERMKAGKEHIVPLPARAIEILEAMKQRSTGDLVFGGERDGRPISDTAMMKALRRAAAGKPTLHGLRSSFRDWCGDQTDFPRDIAEAALAHVISNKAEAAYRRSTALEKRRELMTAWAGYCGTAAKS